MNKKIEELTDLELRAIGFDELEKIDVSKNNVIAIKNELFKRQQQLLINEEKPKVV